MLSLYFPCTPGYWKNHVELWADQPDLPLGYTSSQWLDILKTPSNQGTWYQLAKHYIAAWLNLNAGDVDYEPGYGDDVYAALDNAEALLSSPATLNRQAALELKDFFDIFNNYDRTE